MSLSSEAKELLCVLYTAHVNDDYSNRIGYKALEPKYGADYLKELEDHRYVDVFGRTNTVLMSSNTVEEDMPKLAKTPEVTVSLTTSGLAKAAELVNKNK